MVEVDPRLFVTCRLCLDVQGHFQIDPSVQQQIKYCFDIDVEPFDRLPQLICKRCQKILREHYEIKKNFNEKQKELKSKLQVNAKQASESPPSRMDESDNSTNKAKSSPSQDESDSSTNKAKFNRSPSQILDESDSSSNIENKMDRKKKQKTKKVKKKRIVNRLMSSSDDSDNYQTSSLQTKQKYECDQNCKPWDVNLNKYFVCRICSQGFKEKSQIIKHTNAHSTLLLKHKNIFNMSCLVVMDKSDGKSNMCNSNRSVVYSSDCIIQNKHNPFYYIVYHPKTNSYNIKVYRSRSSKKKLSECGSNFEDGETLSPKKRRLSSRSSSETVVLNRNSELEDISNSALSKVVKIPPTVIDCIDLDDSSDNASCESNEKSSSLKESIDSKPTHNIIKMCHNRYAKKIDSLERETSLHGRLKEEFLQHKVLSIGRKVINNKGFNCTGILRYLEYKDLDVIWNETSILKPSSDGKYVRIATRMKGYETTDPNDSGWKNASTFNSEYEETNNSNNIYKKLKLLSNFKKSKRSKEQTVINEEATINSVEQIPRISSVFSHTDLEITKIDPESMLQKLLNENPVSNPKQLPKKANSNECFIKKLRVFSGPKGSPPSICAIPADETNGRNSNTMPIVTSTVSLAPLPDKEQNTITSADTVISLKNNAQPLYPRIKVKPVSELMPEKTTNHINSNDTLSNEAQNELPCKKGSYNVADINNSYKISNVWSNQNNDQQMCTNQNSLNGQQLWPNQNISSAGQQTWDNQNVVTSEQHYLLNEQQNRISVINASPSPNFTANKECILLDTVEFPNTRTSSPFHYLKNLLLVHNITLVDVDKPIPPGSKCLIKLKLAYQQESCEPITLCLSLFCNKKVFCIKVRDVREIDVDVLNLSAHWQWQLLKIYSDSVVDKVLQTASKISVQTYQYTKHFFTLLKSIKVSDTT